MDLVVPYRELSGNDISLLYALRSAEKFLPHDQLIIIGTPPMALQAGSFTHIHYQDLELAKYREKNIFDKLHMACNNPLISDDFIYMCDDEFLLEPLNGRVFFDYDFGGNSMYKNTVHNTFRKFGGKVKNFDVHCPVVMNKQKFLDSVASLDWLYPYGYCIKTAYHHMNKIDGQYFKDMKFHCGHDRDAQMMFNMVIGGTYFSLDKRCMRDEELKLLQNIYPNRSRYE